MAEKNSKKNKTQQNATIAVNRQAKHEYFIEERFEAGLVLEGWEVKSLREGRVQLKESYVVLKRGEAWLSGAHISALLSASTHIKPDSIRHKKLLLNRHELNKLSMDIFYTFAICGDSSHRQSHKNAQHLFVIP